MIRENYGTISGSSESGSSGSGSGLNEQQVISLINSQTVQNFTNNFSNSDFNSFTNLNNWVNSKVNTIIENPVEEVYNRIKSELYDPQLTHTPISNICFTVKTTNVTAGIAYRESFNTNSLTFSNIETKPHNVGIKITPGDVVAVFYKTRFTNSGQSTPSDYVVNAMMLIVGGLKMSSSGATTVPFNSSGNIKYFRSNPFRDYYYTVFSGYNYQNSIEIKTNAKCMLTTQYTDTINFNYDPSGINYYYLWSGSVDPSDTNYIDFLNVFTPDINNYNIFLSSASDFSALSIQELSGQNLTDQSFYAIGQRNGIQNQVVNMFNDQNILNDLRKVTNLFQTYSLQSIYTGNMYGMCTPLHIDNNESLRTVDAFVSTPTVYLMPMCDKHLNVVALDLVYLPNGPEITIRYPTTIYESYSDGIFHKCNNIFQSHNDLFLTFSGCMNLSRNLTFTINFMNLRNSETSTHLVLYSKSLSFANILNQITRNFRMPKYSSFDFNYLNTNCYHVNLDNLIKQKQGAIMSTSESDNIRIAFNDLA